jgi:hypothetical protein
LFQPPFSTSSSSSSSSFFKSNVYEKFVSLLIDNNEDDSENDNKEEIIKERSERSEIFDEYRKSNENYGLLKKRVLKLNFKPSRNEDIKKNNIDEKEGKIKNENNTFTNIIE